MTTAYINKISNEVPPYDVHEAFVEYAANFFEDERNSLIFRRMAQRAHISHRWSVLEDALGFYGDDPNRIGLKTRMDIFEKIAPTLAVNAVNKLNLGEDVAKITHIIVVTCTGFYTPGLDYDIIEQCGLNPSVERTQIGFMGCYSGVNGLKLAHHIVRSQPDAQVLLVTLEMSTIHLQSTQSLEAMLSYLIFSDGCAAALITSKPEGIALDSFKAVLIPDTRELMTLGFNDRSIQMFLSGKVPGNLSRTLGNKDNQDVIFEGLDKEAIDLWAIHPGGRSILDAVAGALDLNEDQLKISRYVLNNFGNMASATILFVLAEILNTKATGEIEGKVGSGLGFGPGLYAETFMFRT